MIELIQIAWDIFMLRDSARKGQLKLRAVLFALAFVVLLYAIGLPPAVLYSKHPQYRPLFLAAIVVDALLFIVFMVWAVRWNIQMRKPQDAANSTSTSKPSN